MPALYLLHPIMVHFPIALLVAGFVTEAYAAIRRSGSFSPASVWLLRWGAAAAVIAAAAGLLAEEFGPHVPGAWEVLYWHKRLGIATAVSSVALSLIQRWALRKDSLRVVRGVRGLWVALMILLVLTGDKGADLVYEFGVAVKR